MGRGGGAPRDRTRTSCSKGGRSGCSGPAPTLPRSQEEGGGREPGGGDVEAKRVCGFRFCTLNVLYSQRCSNLRIAAIHRIQQKTPSISLPHKYRAPVGSGASKPHHKLTEHKKLANFVDVHSGPLKLAYYVLLDTVPPQCGWRDQIQPNRVQELFLVEEVGGSVELRYGECCEEVWKREEGGRQGSKGFKIWGGGVGAKRGWGSFSIFNLLPSFKKQGASWVG